MKNVTESVNEDEIIRAFWKALKKIASDKSMISDTVSVGLITSIGDKRGQREGYQVFVKVCRYSDVLLKKNRASGGLLCGMP